MNGDLMARDVKNARHVTAKILHLIQTQGERTHTYTEHNYMAGSPSEGSSPINPAKRKKMTPWKA